MGDQYGHIPSGLSSLRCSCTRSNLKKGTENLAGNMLTLDTREFQNLLYNYIRLIILLINFFLTVSCCAIQNTKNSGCLLIKGELPPEKSCRDFHEM